MKVEKKDLDKSQLELVVELSVDEFNPYMAKGAERISREIKIEGFRPGKAPIEVVKSKVGEMAIMEEAARLAINGTIDKAIADNSERQPVGQPQVEITKLAPGNPLQYKVVIALLPEVTLGAYKDLKINAPKVTINKEEIEKTLEQLQEMQAKEAIADREVKDKDKVIADIEMFLDKVPVEGGQSKGIAVMMGKNYVVPGFDKQLLGAKKGDQREFSLPYPNEFHMKNLAGKIVEFRVKIGEVFSREVPALDDNFAAMLGSKNMAELKEQIEKNIEMEKSQQEEQKIEVEMLNKIIENSKFGDIPELLINHETRSILSELEQSITSQGAKFEDYLSSIHKTRDQLALDIAPDAVKRIKSALVMRTIGETEKIEISEEEVNNRVDELVAQYKGYEKVEARVKERGYKEYLRNIMANQKVMKKLKEWNIKK